MADKKFTIITPKRSTVAGKIPLPSQLRRGELAVNLQDKKFYVKDQNDLILDMTVSPEALQEAAAIAGASTGFSDRSLTDLIFTTGVTPSVTIQAAEENDWFFYFGGKKVEKGSSLTYELTEEDKDIGFYLSLNSSGAFVNSGKDPDFKTTVPCAYVHYSSEKGKFLIQGDERHSASRNLDWHYTNFKDVGMAIREVGELFYTLDSPSKVGLKLSACKVALADLELTLSHSDTGLAPFTQNLLGSPAEVKIPTLFALPSGNISLDTYEEVTWTKAPLRYNPSEGGLVAVPDKKYVNYFLVATNCQHYPIKFLVGRNAYDTATEAGTEKLADIGLNFNSMAVLYRIVLQRNDDLTNVGKCVINSVKQAVSKTIFDSTGSTSGGTTSSGDLDAKVDKVEGKGLSQEDFTTTLKNKLVGLERVDELTVTQKQQVLDSVFDITKDGMGFDTRTAILKFTAGSSPTVSVSPKAGETSWYYWYRGLKVIVEGTLTYTVPTANFNTGFYLSLDKLGKFVNTGSLPDMKNTVLCAYVHYSSVSSSFIVEGDERHSADRDTTWHISKHIEQGMQVRVLGALNWTADSGNNIGLQLSSTTVADEDLVHVIQNGTNNDTPFMQTIEGTVNQVILPTLYIGTGGHVTTVADNKVYWSKQPLAYNNTVTKTIVNVDDGKFVNYFIAATNCQKAPIKVIMGRKQFTDINDTTSETLEALGLNFPEIALLYRVVLERQNSLGTVGKCVIKTVQQAASKVIFESSSGSTSTGLVNHNDLLGRSNPDQHPMSSITGLIDKLDELESNIGQGGGGSGADVRKPLPISPLTDDVDVSTEDPLVASDYASLYASDLRNYRRFEVAASTDTSFSYPIFEGEVNANQIKVEPSLSPTATYIWRCKDVALSGAESVWSDYQTFTPVRTFFIKTPTITSPTAGSIDVEERPVITGSGFTVMGGTATHTGTSVRIKKAGVVVWSQENTTPLNNITVPVGILEYSTAYTVEIKYYGTKDTESYWSEAVSFTVMDEPELTDIGEGGTLGFGVGPYPGDAASLVALGLTANADNLNPASANYGNYTHSNGSVMVFIPKFYYRTGSNTSPNFAKYKGNALDVATFATTAAATTAGYRLHRAFIDGGEEKTGFFIDKYILSRTGTTAKSVKNGKPISLATNAGYTNSVGMPNCVGQLLDAIPLAKQRGAQYTSASAFMFSALWILSMAHGQAATSAVNCAWYDATGTKNFPKGCNSSLADVDDATVKYTTAGDTDANKPLTGSATNFAKTTHNGQDNGVCDLNGAMFETGLGVTLPGTTATASAAVGKGHLWVLKESVALASLKNGWNTTGDAWGTEAHLNTLYTKTPVAYDFTVTKYWGNADSEVFYDSPLDGVLPKNDSSVSTAGTNQFGLDQIYPGSASNLMLMFGGHWNYSSSAGLGYRRLYHWSSYSRYFSSSRSCAYGQ